jgi:glutamate-ammonia-ligase adenylyltransferase
MRHDATADLLEKLAGVRARVSGHFKAIFPALPEPGDNPQWMAIWRGMRDELESGDELTGPWSGFMARLKRQSLSDRARRRLDRFMPILLDRIDRTSPDDQTLGAVFDLVIAISRRSAYLVLLVQHAAALDRMLDLFARSPWIASLVIRYPALLDELIDPSLGYQIPAPGDLSQSIERLLNASPDTEPRLEGLNHLKLATTLRIAVAQLQGVLGCDAVLRALTSLADCMVEGVMHLAEEEIRKRHGDLPYSTKDLSENASPEESGVKPGQGLGVIGYGTLGAGELGYASDLDLVFLFRAVDGRSDGDRPLDADRWFARLVQRMLTFMTAITPSGRLYEVDTRLRPNGRAGALVSSLNAFREYQLNEAWTWELQALTRARFVCGDDDIAGEFTRIRSATLIRPRDVNRVRQDLLDMRDRLRLEKDKSAAAKGMDPPGNQSAKHQPGGLVDIEFIAQLGVLGQASNTPAVTLQTSTSGQIRSLVEHGWLDTSSARVLIETMTMLRLQRLDELLTGQPTTAAADTSGAASIYRQFFKSSGTKG